MAYAVTEAITPLGKLQWKKAAEAIDGLGPKELCNESLGDEFFLSRASHIMVFVPEAYEPEWDEELDRLRDVLREDLQILQELWQGRWHVATERVGDVLVVAGTSDPETMDDHDENDPYFVVMRLSGTGILSTLGFKKYREE